MALGDPMVGLPQPHHPHGQQRRENSGRSFQRSRNVVIGRVTLEVQVASVSVDLKSLKEPFSFSFS